MSDVGVDEVLGLEERRWAAMIAKDTATLRDLFADEMSSTHANAVVYTKDSYLQAIEERVFDYRVVERTETDARRVGDTVLVTGRAQMEVAVGPRQVKLDARYSMVWVRKDDRWQFLCWHSTAIPA
jgi:hypothetical protein